MQAVSAAAPLMHQTATTPPVRSGVPRATGPVDTTSYDVTTVAGGPPASQHAKVQTFAMTLYHSMYK